MCSFDTELLCNGYTRNLGPKENSITRLVCLLANFFQGWFVQDGFETC